MRRLYYQHVFPRLLELVMASRAFHKPRRRTLAAAQGRVLEIGFGTGLNLPHYPESLRALEAIDPDPALDRISRGRIARSRIAVELHHFDAERLPFGDESFDTVVSTFTLCSIPEVKHALSELRRVLKPGGQFLFLEHGHSPEPEVARWQERLDPYWSPIAGGCHLNRPIRELVEGAGFKAESATSYYLRKSPRVVGYLTEGVARRT